MIEKLGLESGLSNYDYYHIIEVSPGVKTPGVQSYLPIQAPVHDEIRLHDLRGKRVLDIGCRDGLFCFEAERLGAAEVIGIDTDLSRAAVEFLIPWFGSKIKIFKKNLYNLSVDPSEKFDFVIFAGVLYHLRFPFFGIKRIAEAIKPGGTLIIETGLLLSYSVHPFIYSPLPESSPYDGTSVTFFNHPALVAGLTTLGFTDIQCRNIQVQGAEPRDYPGWNAFLSGPDSSISQSNGIIVGRGTYTCRFDEALEAQEANRELHAYWYGEHLLHSDKSRLERFDAYWAA